MPENLPAPLGGSPPQEISLPRAPLVRVLTQVRFPGILKIEDKGMVASFQEKIYAITLCSRSSPRSALSCSLALVDQR